MTVSDDAIWILRGETTPVVPLPLELKSSTASKVTTWECEVVFTLHSYECDLGMRTRNAVRRQLALDLPRSCVSINGVRVTSADEVYRRVSYPRLCTQAVFAPPIEWLLRMGLVAHELQGNASPMTVDIDHDTIRISKRLGVRHDVWQAALPTLQHWRVLEIGVHADIRHQSVIVSFLGHSHASPSSNRNVPTRHGRHAQTDTSSSPSEE